MQKRYMAIWFRHLLTDGLARRRPELKDLPFVLAAPVKNKIIITASSPAAEREGAFTGMAVADARAATGDLVVVDEVPGQAAKLLRLIGLGAGTRAFLPTTITTVSPMKCLAFIQARPVFS